MSGVHIANHVARRAVDHVQNYFADSDDAYIAHLEEEAQLYDQTDPEGELSPTLLLPALFILLITLIGLFYFSYAIGTVGATLAMIEGNPGDSTSSVRYRDEVGAPLLEKDGKQDVADKDEVEMVAQKPVTASIRATLRHLRSTGGGLKGFRISAFYNLLRDLPAQLLLPVSWGILPRAALSIVMTVLLTRFHLQWTHAMIATPSTKSFFARLFERSPRHRVLYLPSFVHAVAQQAVVLVPAGLVYMLVMEEDGCNATFTAASEGEPQALAIAFLVSILVPISAIIMAVCVLLPSAVTLARIEAALLPEDQETTVPFDREAILGEDLDNETIAKSDCATRRRCYRTVFARTWKTASCAVRVYMLKLYAKAYVIQIAVLLIGIQLAVASTLILGGDKLVIFWRSASAQLQLMLIEAGLDQGQNY